jgi:hypothetical protein
MVIGLCYVVYIKDTLIIIYRRQYIFLNGLNNIGQRSLDYLDILSVHLHNVNYSHIIN